MVFKVRMPKIDANVLEGTIGRWLKQEGEPLRAREPLVEIITDKATFDLESEHDGLLRSRVAPEKSTVPVGYVLALLSEGEGEPLPDVAAENEHTMQRYRASLLFGAAEPEGAAGNSGNAADAGHPRPEATPAARRLARRERVRLEDVARTAQGVIREDDVRDFLRRRHDAQGDAEDAG